MGKYEYADLIIWWLEVGSSKICVRLIGRYILMGAEDELVLVSSNTAS